MYKNQTSAIAIRSQKWIADALIRLLEHNTFFEITITQICQEAQLVRKTFYRNFDTKEDILSFILDQVFLSFREKYQIETSVPKEIFTHYYEFWLEERKLLNYLHRDNLFYLLTRKYIEYADLVHMGVLHKTGVTFRQTGLDSYVIHFIAGGMVSLLEHWLQSDCTEPISTLTKLTETLLLSASAYLNPSIIKPPVQ